MDWLLTLPVRRWNSGLAITGEGCAGVHALEEHSSWFVLGFAAARLLGSIYGFLQDAWLFGLVETVWAAVALRRLSKVRAHPLQ